MPPLEEKVMRKPVPADPVPKLEKPVKVDRWLGAQGRAFDTEAAAASSIAWESFLLVKAEMESVLRGLDWLERRESGAGEIERMTVRLRAAMQAIRGEGASVPGAPGKETPSHG